MSLPVSFGCIALSFGVSSVKDSSIPLSNSGDSSSDVSLEVTAESSSLESFRRVSLVLDLSVAAPVPASPS